MWRVTDVRRRRRIVGMVKHIGERSLGAQPQAFVMAIAFANPALTATVPGPSNEGHCR